MPTISDEQIHSLNKQLNSIFKYSPTVSLNEILGRGNICIRIYQRFMLLNTISQYSSELYLQIERYEINNEKFETRQNNSSYFSKLRLLCK